MEPLAVLGATGYVGRIVCECAREAGLPLRLVGRRRDALKARARDGDEIAVGDARDARGLAEALRGAFAVASTAGPFLAVGTGAIDAALDAGIHYVDPSPEQAFTRRVYEEYGERARERGVAVVPSLGFDYAVGDLAAHLAADGLGPLDEVVVAYSTAPFVPSAGSRTTIGHVLEQPQVSFVGGRLVRSRFGATTRRVRFPSGEATVVEWGGTEPLTVPRHVEVRNVRSYVRAPRVAALAGGVGRFAAPLVKLTGRIGGGPTEKGRRSARFAVVAEARGPAGGRRAVLSGSDVYGLTALLLVRGAEALRAGAARGVGVLAPAEAFDARALVDRLAPRLRVESLEEL